MVDLTEIRAQVSRTPQAALLPPRVEPGRGTAVLLDVVPLRGTEAVLAVLEIDGAIVAAPLLLDGDDVRRARPGEGATEALLELVRASAQLGRFRFQRIAAFPASVGERALEVDQSNESIVVGEAAVVKLLARVRPGPQQALDLPAHLAEVGFRELPAPLGFVTWDSPAGGETLLATAAAFLPDALDGWSWFLDLVRRDIATRGDEGVTASRHTGALVARFHVALATPSSVLPNPVAPWGEGAAAAWRNRALRTLVEALEATSGDVGVHLAARRSRIEEATNATGLAVGPAMRIHGDLHVGQILRWEGGDAVSDFDGNPLAPPEVRVAPMPPARDVASLMRSLDNLARVCERDGASAEEVDHWSSGARTSFLDSYTGTIAGAGRADLLDKRLLGAFEAELACHELVYASRYLPAWLVVADLALRALYP